MANQTLCVHNALDVPSLRLQETTFSLGRFPGGRICAVTKAAAQALQLHSMYTAGAVSVTFPKAVSTTDARVAGSVQACCMDKQVTFTEPPGEVSDVSITAGNDASIHVSIQASDATWFRIFLTFSTSPFFPFSLPHAFCCVINIPRAWCCPDGPVEPLGLPPLIPQRLSTWGFCDP